MHAHPGSNNMEATRPHRTEYLYTEYYSSEPWVSYKQAKMKFFKNPAEFILQAKDKQVYVSSTIKLPTTTSVCWQAAHQIPR